MRPISVCMPVAVTMPTPCRQRCPCRKTACFLRSAAPHVSSHTAFAPLPLGTDSPVSALSRPADARSPKAADRRALRLPRGIYDVPPHECFGGKTARLPSRSTSACGAESVRNASNARSAFASCTVPTNAFRNDDAQNQQRVGQIRFPLHARDGKRHCRRDEQNEHHKIAELQHKFLCKARFLPLLQPIFTVNAEPLFSLRIRSVHAPRRFEGFSQPPPPSWHRIFAFAMGFDIFLPPLSGNSMRGRVRLNFERILS